MENERFMQAFGDIEDIEIQIESLMDAIKKRYLRSMCFSIHEEDTLLESFLFNLSYPKNGTFAYIFNLNLKPNQK